MTLHTTILVEGHLDQEWADWFDGLNITHHPDGTSQIHGILPDQSALYGVLLKLRDLGISLISVERSTEKHNS
jgi:hypothetical protein